MTLAPEKAFVLRAADRQEAFANARAAVESKAIEAAAEPTVLVWPAIVALAAVVLILFAGPACGQTPQTVRAPSEHDWAITARGFNKTKANKLLVLIEGRVVYTPLHAGVFWDVQVTLLEDIDRIEVINGPGATRWGDNAVNGEGDDGH
jgi:hypothetical protein